jgi:hypothetical protein
MVLELEHLRDHFNLLNPSPNGLFGWKSADTNGNKHSSVDISPRTLGLVVATLMPPHVR